MDAIETLCELPTAFAPCAFRIQWAGSTWELAECRRLRRAVFCIEQGVFVGDDVDALDAHAQTLVALSGVGGMNEQVVGTVRIHRDTADVDDGRWWGSRLAVHAAYRNHGHLGAGLIRLAVCSARTLGCTDFRAHVQSQNQALFEKLHWRALAEQSLHGRAHVLMQADLAHYPPCPDPRSGFVTRSRSAA